MFREMRRNKQLLSEEETIAIMERRTHGILACSGDDGYPFAVPVSHVYRNGKIYFHSALAGHKIDAIIRDPKVSFTVIDQDLIVSEKFTTYFRSVIAFGKARIAEGDERMEGFNALFEKFSPLESDDARQKEMESAPRAHVIVIDVEHMTGKEAIELVRARQG